MSRSWRDFEESRADARKELPNEMQDALRRIGDTPDGKLLSKYLSHQFLFNSPPSGSPDGALREWVAMQRLARRLLMLLQSEPDDGRDDIRKRDRRTWIDRVWSILGFR